jgi:hypothetical protein
MFALSGNTTPQGYLTKALERIRQEKTWGNDPLRVHT